MLDYAPKLVSGLTSIGLDDGLVSGIASSGHVISSALYAYLKAVLFIHYVSMKNI